MFFSPLAFFFNPLPLVSGSVNWLFFLGSGCVSLGLVSGLGYLSLTGPFTLQWGPSL